jgi:hypothetical protein
MILLQALVVGAIGYSLGMGMAASFFAIFVHKIATRGIVLLWQVMLVLLNECAPSFRC